MTDHISSQHNDEQRDCGISLIALFESRVSKNPANVALTDTHSTMSYAQVNTRANAIAHQLAKLNAPSNSLIGIAIDHGLDRIVASIGILKAGFGYVILDLGLRDSHLSHLMTHAISPALIHQDRRAQVPSPIFVIHPAAPVCRKASFTISAPQSILLRRSPKRLNQTIKIA